MLTCNQRKRGWNGWKWCGKPARWKQGDKLWCHRCYLDVRPDVKAMIDKL